MCAPCLQWRRTTTARWRPFKACCEGGWGRNETEKDCCVFILYNMKNDISCKLLFRKQCLRVRAPDCHLQCRHSQNLRVYHFNLLHLHLRCRTPDWSSCLLPPCTHTEWLLKQGVCTLGCSYIGVCVSRFNSGRFSGSGSEWNVDVVVVSLSVSPSAGLGFECVAMSRCMVTSSAWMQNKRQTKA